MIGRGGNPPMTPRQALGMPQSRAGSGPAPQNTTFIGRLVLIFGTGPGSGLFVYQGAPKAGNPPVFAVVAPGVTADPYGNLVDAVVTVGNAAGAHIRMDQFGDLVAHSATGNEIWLLPGFPAILEYDNLGNLVASVSPVGGADSSGQAFVEGAATYGKLGATFVAVALAGNQVQWSTAAAVGGPYTAAQQMGLTADGFLAVTNGGLEVIGTAVPLLRVSESTAAPGSPPVQIIGAAAGDRALGVEVAGDAAFRFRLNNQGRQDWGDGTVADTNLYRGAASQLKTDSALVATGGTAANPSLVLTDTWHSLGALGAHYTVTLGRYRLTADNCVELDIKVAGDGLQATAVTFANALPAAYRPATQHDSLPMGTTRQVTAGDVWPRLLVDTAGNVTVNASAVASTFACCQKVPLD